VSPDVVYVLENGVNVNRLAIDLHVVNDVVPVTVARPDALDALTALVLVPVHVVAHCQVMVAGSESDPLDALRALVVVVHVTVARDDLLDALSTLVVILAACDPDFQVSRLAASRLAAGPPAEARAEAA